MHKLIVRGHSLDGLVNNGDEVQVDEDAISVSVGDLIIFKTASTPTVIKSLIGVPGNEIYLHGNTLSINGYEIILNEPQRVIWEDWAQEKIIPEGYVVVMGTNKNSFDSKNFGFLPLEDIIGKVVKINRVNS